MFNNLILVYCCCCCCCCCCYFFGYHNIKVRTIITNLSSLWKSYRYLLFRFRLSHPGIKPTFICTHVSILRTVSDCPLKSSNLILFCYVIVLTIRPCFVFSLSSFPTGSLELKKYPTSPAKKAFKTNNITDY